MRHGSIWLAIPAALVGAALAVWLLWPAQPPFLAPVSVPVTEPSPETSRSPPEDPLALEAEVQTDPTEEHAPESAPTPAEHVEDAEDHHDHVGVEDPTGDLRYYERYPMSAIPHRVARGWGARGTGMVPGAVAVFVVVEPGISDAELETLVRDIRDYHHDAEALSVRVLDSYEAATYDRHADGGALAAQHLVAILSFNERLESNSIEIRGRAVEPDER